MPCVTKTASGPSGRAAIPAVSRVAEERGFGPPTSYVAGSAADFAFASIREV
jgi:hypothetical protein